MPPLASASPDELTLELDNAIYFSWERAVAEDWLGQVGAARWPCEAVEDTALSQAMLPRGMVRHQNPGGAPRQG